jgi:hypothetical protein
MGARVAQGAAIKLELKADPAGGFTLLARAGVDGVEIARGALRATALNVHSALPTALLEVKKKAATVDPEADWPVAAPALLALRDKGTFLANELFEGGTSYFYEFADACASALPPAQRQPDHPPLVELESRADQFLPIELLPLFDQNWPDGLDTALDIEGAAQSFLGFSAIIRRVPPVSIPQDTLLTSQPLSVAFVRNDKLPGAAHEAEVLGKFGRTIVTVDEPLTRADALSADELAAFLSHRIYQPTLSQQPDPPYDQVLHFACHCDTDPASTATWLLRVGNDIKIGMNKLIAELAYRERERRRHEPPPARPPRPLVFMNACDTSTINPSSAASFVQLFLENGNRGFIGTETRIPDQVAAAYSRIFYNHLLDGRTVGDAMHQAKWDLLRQFKNPLGVLYTLYGNPDLAVSTIKGEAA